VVTRAAVVVRHMDNLNVHQFSSTISACRRSRIAAALPDQAYSRTISSRSL